MSKDTNNLLIVLIVSGLIIYLMNNKKCKAAISEKFETVNSKRTILFISIYLINPR